MKVERYIAVIDLDTNMVTVHTVIFDSELTSEDILLYLGYNPDTCLAHISDHSFHLHTKTKAQYIK